MEISSRLFNPSANHVFPLVMEKTKIDFKPQIEALKAIYESNLQNLDECHKNNNTHVSVWNRSLIPCSVGYGLTVTAGTVCCIASCFIGEILANPIACLGSISCCSTVLPAGFLGGNVLAHARYEQGYNEALETIEKIKTYVDVLNTIKEDDTETTLDTIQKFIMNYHNVQYLRSHGLEFKIERKAYNILRCNN